MIEQYLFAVAMTYYLIKLVVVAFSPILLLAGIALIYLGVKK